MKDLYKTDTDSLVGIFTELETENNQFRQRWSRMAKKCTNYANGDQTIDQDVTSTWMNNQPIFNVMAYANPSQLCVNEIEPIIRTLVSYMTRAKPTVSAKTVNHNDIKSKSTAKVAEDVINAKWDLDDEGNHSVDAATWLLTVGTVFAKDYWDPTSGAYFQGKQTGNNAVKILTPFTVSTDWSANHFNEIPYIYENNLVDTDWLKSAYFRNEPGYTNNFDGMAEGEWGDEALVRFEQFKTAVPNLANNGEIKRKGRTLMTELFVPPIAEFPQGRMIVFGGRKVLYATPAQGENPYYLGFMGQQPVWHPFTMAIYEKFLGRLLGKSLVEQLLPIQMRMREIWGTIIENANTLGKPNIIAAKGQLKSGVLTGGGFRLVEYQPVPGASEPHAFNGIPLPPQYFNELQQLSNKMVMIAGTNFVMQGTPPTGVTAASAISQLLENASTQNAPINQRFQRFHEQRMTKKLRIIKKYQYFPDQQLNAVIQGIAKQEYRSTLKIFVGATDLADDADIKVEDSSMIPKSEQSKSETILKLVQNNFFGPVLQDYSPKAEEIRAQVLEQLGLEPLQTAESVDLKKAKWENERMVMGERVEVSPFDIHPIHSGCHKELLQNPNFLENADDEVKKTLFDHIQEHEQAQSQQAEQSMQTQKKEGAEMMLAQSGAKQLEKAPITANPVLTELLMQAQQEQMQGQQEQMQAQPQQQPNLQGIEAPPMGAPLQ